MVPSIPTPEPTLPDVQPSSSTHFNPPSTSTVHNQPISSTIKTRHSPTPPSINLQVTIDIATYTDPSKKILTFLKILFLLTLVFFLLYINMQKNPRQTNNMTDEFLRAHSIFKANLLSSYSLYMTPAT